MVTPLHRRRKKGTSKGDSDSKVEQSVSSASPKARSTPLTHKFRHIESGSYSQSDEELASESFVLKISSAKREIWIRRQPTSKGSGSAQKREVRVPWDHLSSVALFSCHRARCFLELRLKWRPKVNDWPEIFGGGGTTCRIYFADDAFARVCQDIDSCALADKVERLSGSENGIDRLGKTASQSRAGGVSVVSPQSVVQQLQFSPSANQTAEDEDRKFGGPIAMDLEELAEELEAVHFEASHAAAASDNADGSLSELKNGVESMTEHVLDETEDEHKDLSRASVTGLELAADAGQPHPLNVSTGKKYALVIGIDHFMDPQISDLECANADVAMLEEVLKGAGYIVRTMHDNVDKSESWRMPLYMNIRVQLRDFCCSPLLKPEDTLLVYIATHGIRHKDRPMLLCMDSRLSLLENGDSKGSGLADESLWGAGQQRPFLDPALSTVIPLSVIESHIEQSTACRKMLLLDCCYAGVEVGRGLSLPSKSVNQQLSSAIMSSRRNARDTLGTPDLFVGHEFGQGFGVLHATTARQKAAEADGHGLFTGALVDALSPVDCRQESSHVDSLENVTRTARCDMLRKGYATFSEVCRFVHERVKIDSFLMGWELQEPTHRFVGVGDLVVVDYRTKPFRI